MTQLKNLLKKALKTKPSLGKTSVNMSLKTSIEEVIVRDNDGEHKAYEYYLEGTLSNTQKDYTGRKFSKSALEYIYPDSLVTVLVGDKEKIQQQLRDTDFGEIVFL
jgi:hypothetical protein